MAEVIQDSDTASLIARRKRLLGPAYSLFYEKPVHLVKGEGVWLIDADGKKYLDMYNNVPHVGHCHPYVVRALQKQIFGIASRACRSRQREVDLSPRR